MAKLGLRDTPPVVLGLGDNVYEEGLPGGDWQNSDGVDPAEKAAHSKFGDVYRVVKYRTNPKGDTDAGWTHPTFFVAPGNHDYDKDIEAGGVRIARAETTPERLFDGKDGAPTYEHVPFHHTTGKVDVPACDAPKPALTLYDLNGEDEYQAIRAAVRAGRLHELTRPQEVISTDLVQVIALDTQMIIQLYQDGHDADAARHMADLRDLLDKSDAEWKVVFGHHPLVTRGRHGGFTSAAEWLWTGPHDVLTKYIHTGLPLVPTALALLREGVRRVPYSDRVLGHLWGRGMQDIDNRHNRKFRDALTKLMGGDRADIYLAGHDHELQMLSLDDNPDTGPYQIVSGSAGKLSPVTDKKGTLFAHEAYGFVRLDIQDEEMWVTFVSEDPNSGAFTTEREDGCWSSTHKTFLIRRGR